MATRPKIFLDKEKITKLIKVVFDEEFKKQEVDITKIISSNFTLRIKETKSLKQDVNDLKESKEFTQNDLKKKLLMWRKKSPRQKVFQKKAEIIQKISGTSNYFERRKI